MQKNKENEFLHLTNRGLTVIEYEQKFQELSHFSTRVIGDDENMIERFMDGLNPNIRIAVYSLKASCRSMDEIVEITQVAELGNVELKGNAKFPT